MESVTYVHVFAERAGKLTVSKTEPRLAESSSTQAKSPTFRATLERIQKLTLFPGRIVKAVDERKHSPLAPVPAVPAYVHRIEFVPSCPLPTALMDIFASPDQFVVTSAASKRTDMESNFTVAAPMSVVYRNPYESCAVLAAPKVTDVYFQVFAVSAGIAKISSGLAKLALLSSSQERLPLAVFTLDLIHMPTRCPFVPFAAPPQLIAPP